MPPESENSGSFITKWLEQAARVKTSYALAAFGVVGVIVLVAFVIAPKLELVQFNPWQALVLVTMLLAALVILVLFGPRERHGHIQAREQGVDAASPLGAVTPAKPLGLPPPGKPGVLVDLSHGQDKWREGSVSVFDLAATSRLSAVATGSAADPPWHLVAVKDRLQLLSPDLAGWRGLLLGMPFHAQLADDAEDALVAWVRQGGRLVVLGYELGERHHHSRINHLMEAFGLRFNSDIVAPAGFAPASAKPYGLEVHFASVASDHELMAGVKRICLRNVCTLTIEPGSKVILPIGQHRVSREVAPRYTDGWTSSGAQAFDLLPEAPWLPLIAEAPAGLTGRGRVVAIGTWDFSGTDPCFAEGNRQFLHNLIRWLAST